MKKLLSLTLVSVLLLSLAACGQIPADKNRGDDSTDEPQTIVTTTAPENSETPNVTEPQATESQTEKPADTTAPQATDTTKTPDTTKAPTTTKAPVTTKTPEPTKPAHKHAYTTNVQNATCTANGRKIYTCACGDAYSETLKATGHKWGNWNLHKLPTLTANGQYLRSCSACSATETKASGKLIKNNSFVNTNNNLLTIGEVTVRPRTMYWSEDGKLYVECFIINGLDTTVSNVIVNKLTFFANGKKVATDTFGKLSNVTIGPRQHQIWTFCFAPTSYGVALNSVDCQFDISYNH